MSRIGRLAPMLMCLATLCAAASALAQENLDAGKTPPQLFASDCSVCHKSPRGLASGISSYSLTNFLRQHYTSSRQSASAIAGYLLSGAGNGGPSQSATASRTPAPSREHGAPASKQDAKRKREEPGRPAAAHLPEKKPPERKDASKKIEQAAVPPEKSAQGDRSEGEPKPIPPAAIPAPKPPTTTAVTEHQPVRTSASGASVGESSGGPLSNAVPLAGALPAMGPPPPRTDNIAD